MPRAPTATPIAAPPASSHTTSPMMGSGLVPCAPCWLSRVTAEDGRRVVQARLALEHPGEDRRQRQPPQHGEDRGGVGRREDRAEEQCLPPAQAEQPVRAGRDHADADDDPHGGQRDRRGGGPPGVLPVGGEAAFRQDQHQRDKPERLGQVRVVEPDAEAALAERQAESEEDEECGQAGAVRQPGRHDGREHRGRADQQVESEGARCHTFSIRAGRGVLVKADAPGRPPGDRRCR